MVMAAILVVISRPFEQTFVALSQGGSTSNLTSIDPAVLKEKMLENVHRRQKTTDDDNGAYAYYKLTSEAKAKRANKTTQFHTKSDHKTNCIMEDKIHFYTCSASTKNYQVLYQNYSGVLARNDFFYNEIITYHNIYAP